jgi:hypothetical protein
MANSAGTFTVTITTTGAQHGETGKAMTERYVIGDMLEQVAQDVRAGRPSRAIIDANNVSIGSYSYGAGMINAGA